MRRTDRVWDIRCPEVLRALFPREARRGYWYKVTRAQARVIVQMLCVAYDLDPGLVTVNDVNAKGANGYCYYMRDGSSVISIWGRAHIKTVFHEFYHALEHATGMYDSNDRTGGPASLAWQFADHLWDALRDCAPRYFGPSASTNTRAIAHQMRKKSPISTRR